MLQGVREEQEHEGFNRADSDKPDGGEGILSPNPVFDQCL
jgi:hypothetical protein